MPCAATAGPGDSMQVTPADGPPPPPPPAGGAAGKMEGGGRADAGLEGRETESRVQLMASMAWSVGPAAATDGGRSDHTALPGREEAAVGGGGREKTRETVGAAAAEVVGLAQLPEEGLLPDAWSEKQGKAPEVHVESVHAATRSRGGESMALSELAGRDVAKESAGAVAFSPAAVSGSYAFLPPLSAGSRSEAEESGMPRNELGTTPLPMSGITESGALEQSVLGVIKDERVELPRAKMLFQPGNCEVNEKNCLPRKDKDPAGTACPSETRTWDRKEGNNISIVSDEVIRDLVDDLSHQEEAELNKLRWKRVRTELSPKKRFTVCETDPLIADIDMKNERDTSVDLDQLEGICVLCKRSVLQSYLVRHAFIDISSFRICQWCSEVIGERHETFQEQRRKRAHATNGAFLAGDVHLPRRDESVDGINAPRRIRAYPGGKEELERNEGNSTDYLVNENFRPQPRASLHMLAFIERCFLRIPQKLLKFLGTEEYWNQWIAKASVVPKDKVSPDIITILLKAFISIGLFDVYTLLKWPCEVFELPNDVTEIVNLDAKESFSKEANAASAGVNAWNEAFPDCKWSKWGMSECLVFNELFGLIGIKLDYVNQSESGGNFKCKMNSRDFVRSLRGAYHFAGPELRRMLHGYYKGELLVSPSPARVPAGHECPDLSGTASSARDSPSSSCPGDSGEDTAGDVGEGSRTGNLCEDCQSLAANKSGLQTLCSSCACAPSDGYYPLKLRKCDGCDRRFCSLCLSRAFGVPEYITAIRSIEWYCMKCRFDNRSRTAIMSLMNSRERNAAGLDSKKGPRNGSASNEEHPLPLVLVGNRVSRSVQRLSGGRFKASKAAFAAYCEELNEYNILLSGRRESKPRPPSRCFLCKHKPACKDGSLSGMILCNYGACNKIFHRQCVEMFDGRLTESWSCRWHRCASCDDPAIHSERLIRCRTCPVAYCENHLPALGRIHVFSTSWIACERCTSWLDAPLLPLGRKYKSTIFHHSKDTACFGKHRIQNFLYCESERRKATIRAIESFSNGAEKRELEHIVKLAKKRRVEEQ